MKITGEFLDLLLWITLMMKILKILLPMPITNPKILKSLLIRDISLIFGMISWTGRKFIESGLELINLWNLSDY